MRDSEKSGPSSMGRPQIAAASTTSSTATTTASTFSAVGIPRRFAPPSAVVCRRVPGWVCGPPESATHVSPSSVDHTSRPRASEAVPEAARGGVAGGETGFVGTDPAGADRADAGRGAAGAAGAADAAGTACAADADAEGADCADARAGAADARAGDAGRAAPDVS